MALPRRTVRAWLTVAALAAATGAWPLRAQDDEATRKKLSRALQESRRHPRGEARGGDRVLGLTLWRSSASQPSFLRLLPTTRVAAGDRIVLGLETASTDYVYVLRRALLAGAGLGPPYLVHPTPLTTGSPLAAGRRLVEVPHRGERPQGFLLERSGAEQRGERFSILVMSSPLNAPAGGGKSPLPGALVAAWERQATALVVRIDAATAGPGTRTPAEDVALQGARRVSADDPLPQSLIQIRTTADEPALFSIDLLFAD